MEYIDTKDPKAFKDFETTMLEGLTPISGEPEGNLLPTALKPIIENWGNRNFFLERPIVPEDKKDLKAPYQYSRYTSEAAKTLGEHLDMSPAKIENLIKGWTGGSGQYALQGVDALTAAIKAAQGQPAVPKRPKELADYPVVKGFVGRDPTGPQAQSIQDFYEGSQKAIEAYDTYSQIYGAIEARKQQQDSLEKLRKQRALTTAEKQAVRPLTPLEQQEYAKAAKFKKANPDIIKAPLVKSVRELLSKLSKEADEVIKMDIPDKEKRARLKKIDAARLRAAQQANKLMK